MQQSDICIAGAGIIGLSLALELHHRGARVTVLDQGTPLSEASTAAAGMLAASDPDNPPQLRPLANLSLTLYPGFLDRLRTLSGITVPFHTSKTLQAIPPHTTNTTGALASEDIHRILPQLTPGSHRFLLLDENSLDPRQLAAALLAAARATTIDIRTQTKFLSAHSHNQAIELKTTAGVFHAAEFVNCTGAWASTSSLLQVAPKKGQMLVVSLPAALQLRTVVRTSEIYIVPRAAGPDPLRAVVGATVEDVGFDKVVHPRDIAKLQTRAAALLPDIATAPILETWAGLRPATSDCLPLLGPSAQPNCFFATGHYRNGILLAPATARVMAQLLTGETPSIDLAPFSPLRVLRRSG